MKKNTSYREKLLELAQIYGINEVKNYIKNKKYLTTSQIELILRKNKVAIPKEINKNILQIHSKKITKPFSSLGEILTNIFNSTSGNILSFFTIIYRNINKSFFKVRDEIVSLLLWISKTTVNTLNKAHYFKVEEKKANKIVTGAATAVFIFLALFGGNQIIKVNFNDEIIKADVEENKIKLDSKKNKKKEVVKIPEKKIEKKEVVKIPEKKIEKKGFVKTPNKKSNLNEFILPNLNLKTETVLTLFDDVDYDLKKVRSNKRVQPIYFTQFPKDLEKISSVKLKKETFIKIILPLVVAENQKILDDKYKLKKILSKKTPTDKEKLWLRQKFKEYKIKKGSTDELQKRMDIIPISIALSQAAKESGWGTSRFALEGNAIFGQWTWTGRGLAPLDRNEEASHKILRFPILRASVKAYKNNLNTHKSYKKFREVRFDLRKKDKPIKGLSLIYTLDSYAETGAEYIKILKQIIEQNSLTDFENVRLTNTAEINELNL